MKKKILRLFVILCAVITCNAQEYDTKIERLIEKAVKLNRLNGTVLVSKKGKIVYEKAFGYQNVEQKILNSTKTVYQIGSTTKEFTAAVILKLIEKHKLTLDDKLSIYFPEIVRGNEITIKHLLTHTSGIYEILNYIEQNNKDGENEKINGKSYEQVVKDFILKPLGMKHTGFDFIGLQSSNKAVGYSKYTKTEKEASKPWDSTATYSAGSLYSTVEDLYRWYKGLLNYKVYNKASLEKATTPFLQGYGLGCWIDMIYDKKVVSHGGNIFEFTGYFGRIQKEDVSIIILNNIFNRQIETIGLSILAILYDKPYSFLDEINLSDNILNKYVGTYEVSNDYKVKITRIGNQLFIQRNTFFQKDDDITIAFKGEKDAINKITIMEGLSTKRGDKIKQ